MTLLSRLLAAPCDVPAPNPPEARPRPTRDLLQRHLLCQATGLHDRGPDDRCRDCRVLLDGSAPTCAERVAPGRAVNP